MAVKKGRGKPKPNKVYHAPNNGAMRRMQQSLHRYDDKVTQFELKWGVDRVIWLVPTELRNRFEQQMDRLNDAIDKMQDVGKDKLKYELELMAWQQDCASLEKTIQEEKYRIEIE